MGCCISWDRNKSIWAVRILSEVLLCTGIVSCVAAFTIEQGKPHIYLLVIGLVLFLFASIGLASSFCLSHDGKKGKNDPVYTVTLPPTSLPPGSMIHPISTVSNSKSKMFASMKSIQVDSEAAIVAPKHHKSSKQSKYKQSDKLSSINEKTKSTDSTSDEGFNSGGQTTTTNSPDMDRNEKKQRRRKQRRNRTESRAPSQSRTTSSKSSKSSDEYLTRI